MIGYVYDIFIKLKFWWFQDAFSSFRTSSLTQSALALTHAGGFRWHLSGGLGAGLYIQLEPAPLSEAPSCPLPRSLGRPSTPTPMSAAPPACHAPILYLLVGGAPQSRPLSSRNSNSKQKKSPRCFLNTQLVVMASTASRLWPALFPLEELEGAAWPWLCTHSGTCHVYAPIICCFRGTCCCCCRAPVLPDSSAFSAGPLKSFLKMQYSKRTYELCLVIFKFFNCSIAVDVRYYFYISSRCITQWLGICTPYEVITPISLVPIWHT